jgi:hypothetical protein
MSAPLEDGERPAPLAALFSTGRSGSTWLGALLGSHEQIVYRFEPSPFSKGICAQTAESIEGFLHPESSRLSPHEVKQGLLQSNPYVDKPPFVRKSGSPRREALKPYLWPLTRAYPRLIPLWERLFTPTACDTLLVKFVAHEPGCRRLLAMNRLPVIYLARHPFGVVSSLVKGQSKGLMPSGRARTIEQFLSENAPALYQTFGARLNEMGAHQVEALLWRWSVEASTGLADGEAPDKLLMVFYENVCRDPASEAARALRFLGLEPDAAVREFVDKTTNPDARGLKEAGINKYFSIFRNPIESMEKWRADLSSAQQADILEIVRASPVFVRGVEEARWASQPIS